METWIPVVVAVIAAIASVFASLRAREQASAARASAEMLDSRAHRIARIDREVEELREAYKEYALAMGAMKQPSDGGRVMAALEVLASCQAVDLLLSTAALKQSDVVARSIATGSPAGIEMESVRAQYMRVQKGLATRRATEATDK